MGGDRGWGGGKAGAGASPRPRSYLARLLLATAAGGAQGAHALLLLFLHFGFQVLDVHQVGLLLGLPRAQLQLQGLLLLLQEVELGLQLGHLLLRSTDAVRHSRRGSRMARGKAGLRPGRPRLGPTPCGGVTTSKLGEEDREDTSQLSPPSEGLVCTKPRALSLCGP